jgi:hypothetical protein
MLALAFRPRTIHAVTFRHSESLDDRVTIPSGRPSAKDVGPGLLFVVLGVLGFVIIVSIILFTLGVAAFYISGALLGQD